MVISYCGGFIPPATTLLLFIVQATTLFVLHVSAVSIWQLLAASNGLVEDLRVNGLAFDPHLLGSQKTDNMGVSKCRFSIVGLGRALHSRIPASRAPGPQSLSNRYIAQPNSLNPRAPLPLKLKNPNPQPANPETHSPQPQTLFPEP